MKRVLQNAYTQEQYGTENVLQSTAHCTGLPGEGVLSTALTSTVGLTGENPSTATITSRPLVSLLHL